MASAPAEIRAYRPADRAALSRICLLTGDNGGDASATFTDPCLVGRYYAEPYVEYQPELALMLEDAAGPCGYVLGALDTAAFTAWCNAVWLPRVRAEYQGRAARPGARDGWLYALLREEVTVPPCAAAYPAHLHIDLLPRAQGQGAGRRLLEAWLAMAAARGATGVHLGVAPANERAIGFYRHLGFTRLDSPAGTVVFGRRLAPAADVVSG